MGIFKKASLVGANTVNVPGPDRVSTRPAAFTADRITASRMDGSPRMLEDFITGPC